MGLSGMFGYGKKEKIPFKVPREVAALRTGIHAEERENYPNFARYQDLAREADQVYTMLDDIIMGNEYAEEAARIREDIKRRMDGLKAKIQKNRLEAHKDGKHDFVEKNIDYLERKSFRNKAKTLFAEFLADTESIMKYCAEGTLDPGRTIGSMAEDLMKTLSELNTNFFKEQGGDKEIQGLKEEVIRKLSELTGCVEANRAGLIEKGLEADLATNMEKISAMAQQLSGD